MARFTIIAILLLVFLTSCSKEEGEGGDSVIKGKVFVHLYDKTGSILLDQFYAPEEDVYIIYGNDEIYSDRFRTNFDGGYRFKYLRQGEYTVFAYSEDIGGGEPFRLVAVKKTVKITENDQQVTVEDIVVNRTD